jgi:hypothetical protein
VGIDVVHFDRGQKTGNRRPCAAAAVRAGEERVLARDRLRPDRVLNRVGVQLDASVRQETLERGTARQSIADRLGQLRLARQSGDTAIPDIALHLRCSKFGSRQIKIMINVKELYATAHEADHAGR